MLFIIFQEKSDLIEFILHKFMVEAENNPFSCALQLFGEMPVKLEKRLVYWISYMKFNLTR